ncbi:DNA repair protein xrcc3 [Coemansia sp. RSA 2607]|nr:DNA repair protein xrcc3 [Coemansia sp. RSA 2607]
MADTENVAADADRDYVSEVQTKLGVETAGECLLAGRTTVQQTCGLTLTQTTQALQQLSAATYPWQQHVQLSGQMQPGERWLGTGSARVDACLGGRGLLCGHLVEIVGESGSGKTQLCLQLVAAQLAQQPAAHVVYVCTEGPVPVTRLSEILASRAGSAAQQMLGRVHVAELHDPEEFAHALEYKVSSMVTGGHVQLVVVDSIAGQLRVGDDGEGEQGFFRRRARLLLRLGRVMRRWAAAGCLVVCVNQVTDVVGRWGALGDGRAPALGSTWANVVDARVVVRQLRQAPGTPTRRWIALDFAPWAAPAQCEVSLGAGGFS